MPTINIDRVIEHEEKALKLWLDKGRISKLEYDEELAALHLWAKKEYLRIEKSNI